MSVRERQNEQRSLDRLVAQRFRYRQAKVVECWRLAAVLAVAALLLGGLAADGGIFGQAATVVVVLLWFIDQVFLVRCAGRMKAEAAAIQEDFDCYVLGIPWPEHGEAKQPTQDRVDELATKGYEIEAVRKGLDDWYGGDDIPADPLAAQLHCQRANCRWDARQRREWVSLVVGVVAVTVAGGLTVAALTGVTVLAVVLATAAGLRLLAWLWMEVRTQSDAKKRMESLHAYLSRPTVQTGQMTSCDIRLVQTAIFENRRSGPTVPEWFYLFRRRKHQATKGG